MLLSRSRQAGSPPKDAFLCNENVNCILGEISSAPLSLQFPIINGTDSVVAIESDQDATQLENWFRDIEQETWNFPSRILGSPAFSEGWQLLGIQRADSPVKRLPRSLILHNSVEGPTAGISTQIEQPLVRLESTEKTPDNQTLKLIPRPWSCGMTHPRLA